MATIAPIGIGEVIVSAVITRADGTVEDQGIISHWKRGEEEKKASSFPFMHKLYNILKGTGL